MGASFPWCDIFLLRTMPAVLLHDMLLSSGGKGGGGELVLHSTLW